MATVTWTWHTSITFTGSAGWYVFYLHLPSSVVTLFLTLWSCPYFLPTFLLAMGVLLGALSNSSALATNPQSEAADIVHINTPSGCLINNGHHIADKHQIAFGCCFLRKQALMVHASEPCLTFCGRCYHISVSVACRLQKHICRPTTRC